MDRLIGLCEKYWMAIAGSALILFSLGYFLWYAFNMPWLSIGSKVVCSYALAGGTFVGGILLHSRSRTGSNVLLAIGGIASFLISYLAHVYLGLFDLKTTLVFVCATIVPIALVSIRFNSQPLISLATFGGFIIPAFIPLSPNAFPDLTFYILALQIIFLALAVSYQWPVVLMLASCGPVLSFFTFVIDTPEWFFILESVFLLSAVTLAILKRNWYQSAIVPLALWMPATWLACHGEYSYCWPLFSVGFITFSYLSYKINEENPSRATRRFLFVSAVLIGIWMPWAFPPKMSYLWSVVCGSGLIMGVIYAITKYVKRPTLTRVIPLLYIHVFAFCFLEIFLSDEITKKIFSFELLLLALILGISQFLIAKGEFFNPRKTWQWTPGMLSAICLLTQFYMLGQHYFELLACRSLVLLIASFVAVSSFYLSKKYMNQNLKIFSYILSVIIFVRLFLYELWEMPILAKMITFFFIGIMFIATAFIQNKAKTPPPIPNQE